VNVPPAKKARTPEAAEAGERAAVPSGLDFEKSLARLEDVVKRLEQPNLPLTDAMKLFEEGLQLAQQCQKQLQEAEGRVEILLKSADGKLVVEPFRPKGADEDAES
jgi:exodeoxyribonuclease VII small subunit